ncbi:MAG: AtpZ/AtpI family protein [[Eubacterium] siraeum]
MNKKDNPLKVYAVVSQIGFLVITPLLIFIWGGSVLVNKFSLPSWVMILLVFAGIITMISEWELILRTL